jgi:streptogramin lyase
MLKFMFNASSLSWAVGVVLVLGFTGTTEAKSPPTVTKLVTLDPAVGELPESITTDDHGHVFFSLVNGQIRELLPDKSTVTIATVPVPAGGNMIGIKVGPDGLIYTTTASLSSADAAAFVWRTDPDTGVVEKFATLDPNGFPNDMAFEDDGSFLVTDSFLGRLYRIDANGQVTVAVSDALLRGNPAAQAFPTHDFGANGIAWDQAEQNLYVSVTDFGRVVRFPFSCRGGLGRPKVVVESPQLKGIDGIALDRSGTIYAATSGDAPPSTLRARSSTARRPSPSVVHTATRRPPTSPTSPSTASWPERLRARPSCRCPYPCPAPISIESVNQ